MHQFRVLFVRTLLAGFCLGLLLVPHAMASAEASASSPSMKMSNLSFLEEAERLTLTEAVDLRSRKRFEHLPNMAPNLGITRKTFWFHLEITNPSRSAMHKIFEIAYARLDHVEFYVLDQNFQLLRSYETGTNYPTRSKAIDHVNFAFPLEFADAPSLNIFMRVHTQSPYRMPLRLWDDQAFYKERQIAILGQGLFYGSVAIMIIYNLFIFFWTRDLAYLYYCLFVLSSESYLAANAGLLMQYVFPETPYINSRVIVPSLLAANLFGVFFALRFLNLAANDRLFYKIASIVKYSVLLAIPLFFFTGYKVYPKFFTFLSFASALILVTCSVRGLLRRQREAYFYFAAWAFLLSGTLSFGLLSLGLVPSVFFTEHGLKIGVLLEIIILALALADRLNRLRQSLEHANQKLAFHIEHVEQVVEEKIQDIRSIMEHIEFGIFTILPDFRIDRDHSLYMRQLFETNSLENRDALELIFHGSQVSADVQSQVRSALFLTFGEDRISFELNRSCLVDHIQIRVEGRDKFIDLTWNPICLEHGRVAKILVTVQDVTMIRHLERNASLQRREMEIVQQILEVPSTSFQSFMRSARQLLSECKKRTNEATRHEPSVMRSVLINVHTLKGMARSLYFHPITNLVHTMEQRYLGYSAAAISETEQEVIKHDLECLDEMLSQYEAIAEQKLGRTTSTEGMSLKEVENICSILKRHQQHLDQEALSLLYSYERRLYIPASTVIRDCLLPADKLAQELGKAIPELVVEAEGFGIASRGADIIQRIFTHLVRNSIDHGLESPATREAMGKSSQGHIFVKLAEEGDSMVIHYADDGRGLNMQKLKEIGLHGGLIDEDAVDQDIAELIFATGLTTSPLASQISGRGIGMDAVQSMMRKEGGDVALVLERASSLNRDFRSFRILITVPKPFWSHLQLNQDMPLAG